MTLVRTSSKYQIAIPKRIRTKLGIRPGQQLAIDEKDGIIQMVPMPADPIDFLWGCLEDGPPLAQELLEERARDLEHE